MYIMHLIIPFVQTFIASVIWYIVLIKLFLASSFALPKVIKNGYIQHLGAAKSRSENRYLKGFKRATFSHKQKEIIISEERSYFVNL